LRIRVFIINKWLKASLQAFTVCIQKQTLLPGNIREIFRVTNNKMSFGRKQVALRRQSRSTHLW